MSVSSFKSQKDKLKMLREHLYTLIIKLCMPLYITGFLLEVLFLYCKQEHYRLQWSLTPLSPLAPLTCTYQRNIFDDCVRGLNTQVLKLQQVIFGNLVEGMPVCWDASKVQSRHNTASRYLSLTWPHEHRHQRFPQRKRRQTSELNDISFPGCTLRDVASLQIRAKAAALASTTNWLFTFLVVMYTPVAIDLSHTTGQTLEDIDLIFEGEKGIFLGPSSARRAQEIVRRRNQ
ncbi:hypothetical protein CPB85DRAFT_1483447 [Mucidula mucida]|nr:hypothetical protein CPB85DRAFT_1483443 [Mucidula mucida]KAF8891164.1 hypothetical protein CPB85DRAFT_1483447 [Mucidula mucida]